MKRSIKLLIIIIFFTFTSFIVISFAESNLSSPNYFHCNEPSDVDNKKINIKFGASEKAWKCMDEKLKSCQPAIVYGGFSNNNKIKPVYFSVRGPGKDGGCYFTGPYQHPKTKEIIGTSCFVSDIQLQSAFRMLNDSNQIFYKTFKSNGPGFCDYINLYRKDVVPYCQPLYSNNNPNNCNIYYDTEQYMTIFKKTKVKPITITEKEVESLSLPTDILTNYKNFQPYKYLKSDLISNLHNAPTGYLVNFARSININLNPSSKLVINNRDQSIKMIDENDPITYLLKSSDSNSFSTSSPILAGFSMYIDSFSMSSEKPTINSGISLICKYKNVYPFISNAVWNDGKTCAGTLTAGNRSSSFISKVHGFIDSDGNIISTGYQCIDTTDSKFSVSSQAGFIWNTETIYKLCELL